MGGVTFVMISCKQFNIDVRCRGRIALTTKALDEFSEITFHLVVYSNVEEPKRLRIHVCSRGCWRKWMTHSQCCKILSCQPNFTLETSRLEQWWIHEGHGDAHESVEVEDDWDKDKHEFYNQINNCSTRFKFYRDCVLRSLGKHQLLLVHSGSIQTAVVQTKLNGVFTKQTTTYVCISCL